MKTWQALKAADEGKKIRRKCCRKGYYSFKMLEPFFQEEALVTRCDFECDEPPWDGADDLAWDDIFATDWEIYKEEENERTDKSFTK